MISLGIDIGEFSIKVAEVEASSKGYVVRRVQEFPLSLDLTKDKKIEIIDTLRTLFANYPEEQTQFVFGLPQKVVSSRLINLPFRERFKVQKAIIPQLEDELPFSQDDAIFDAKIVRFTGRGADILAMATPLEHVTEMLNLAHDCGVEPLLISTEALGLNNLFENWIDAPPEGPSPEQDIPAERQAELVLNIGHSNTEALIYADRVLVGVRNLDWGARNLAEAIGKKYGLNYIQGMRELQLKGFVMLDRSQGTREQAQFSEIMEQALAPLIGDLKLKMLELQSEMRLQWTKATLLGGGSQLRNLSAYLTQQFEIPFNRYKVFDHVPMSADAQPNLEYSAGVAIGLGIEALRRPRNPAANFLKGELAKKANVLEAAWEKWGYATKIAAAAFAILLVGGMIRANLATHVLDRSDEALKLQAQAVAGLKGREATPSRIQKFIDNQEKIEKARKQAEKINGMNSALDVLNRLSGALPANSIAPLEIKRISINGDQAEIHGYSASAQGRDAVLMALQKLALDKVQATEVRITPPAGKVGFAYKFKVNRFGG